MELVNNSEIDKSRWDEIIDNSIHGIVYAKSWYLDVAWPEWGAIIEGDYDYIMPVAFLNKNAIQPWFVRQSGVFSLSEIPEDTVKNFLDFLRKNSREIDIFLNTGNKLSNLDQLDLRITYEINMNNSYSRIQAGYTEEALIKIRSTREKGFYVRYDLKARDVVNFKKVHNGDKSQEWYERLGRILEKSQELRKGQGFGVFTPDNIPVATAFFICTKRRFIFISSAEDQNGTNNHSMYLMLDHFIKKNAEKNMKLEFEEFNLQKSGELYTELGAKPIHFNRVRLERKKVLGIF
jgi:hypothetical protein